MKMMKKRIFKLSLALVIFANGLLLTAQEMKVNLAESNVHWLGKKVTGQHEGNLSLQSGVLTMDNGVLTGGTFVVDMNSMTCTDLEGSSAGNLIGHLKSDDFFSVEKYPEARLNITQVESKGNGLYSITGDFTIKGITHPATFDLTMSENTATANVIIDRSKYDVRYGSNTFFDNLGNKAIYNDFELTVNLKL